MTESDRHTDTVLVIDDLRADVTEMSAIEVRMGRRSGWEIAVNVDGGWRVHAIASKRDTAEDYTERLRERVIGGGNPIRQANA